MDLHTQNLKHLILKDSIIVLFHRFILEDKQKVKKKVL